MNVGEMNEDPKNVTVLNVFKSLFSIVIFSWRLDSLSKPQITYMEIYLNFIKLNDITSS